MNLAKYFVRKSMKKLVKLFRIPVSFTNSVKRKVKEHDCGNPGIVKKKIKKVMLKQMVEQLKQLFLTC